jgi:hypothetical protein
MEEAKRLFELYLEEKTTPQQEDILFRYLADGKNKDPGFYEIMKKAWQKESTSVDYSPEAYKALEQIWDKLEPQKQKEPGDSAYKKTSKD